MIYNILNGDALKEQLPESINGERIIMRECLIQGNVQGKTLKDFLSNRAAFISQQYKGFPEADYWENVAPEIERIKDIPQGAEIYFWFEKDLFCQINWWFTVYLVHQQLKQTKTYLVLPTTALQYGFGGMDKDDFSKAKDLAIPLVDDLPLLAKLWPLYQQRDYINLQESAQQLIKNFPFISAAVQAEKDRHPQNGHPGKPQRLLQEIQKEFDTKEFGTLFREFTKRGAIYGFGDLQIKQILEEMNSN